MQSFSSDGVKIAYIDMAPTSDVPKHRTVMLVHGFASSHMINWVNTQWTKTLTHAGYRVVALDNRGHGRSGNATSWNIAQTGARHRARRATHAANGTFIAFQP